MLTEKEKTWNNDDYLKNAAIISGIKISYVDDHGISYENRGDIPKGRKFELVCTPC